MKTLGLLSVLLIGTSTVACAFEQGYTLSDKPTLSAPSASRWELGIDVAGQFPFGERERSATISNDVGNSAVELAEEYTERGLAPPSSSASTTLTSKMRNSFEVGFHAYYRLASFLELGIDGGYGFDSEGELLGTGPYIAPLFAVDYFTKIAHVGPSIKAGPWIGWLHPYGIAGIGDYIVTDRVKVSITDPLDVEDPPVNIFLKTDNYFGSHVGGGIEAHIGAGGLIGLSCQVHHVYVPGQSILFLSPGLVFSYIF